MSEVEKLAERYVAVWNEADPEVVRTLEARGYDALEKRIVGSNNSNERIAC